MGNKRNKSRCVAFFVVGGRGDTKRDSGFSLAFSGTISILKTVHVLTTHYTIYRFLYQIYSIGMKSI